MADAKISELTELSAAPATNDLLVLVDVSDTTDAASGTTKKIQWDNAVPDSSTTVKGKVELATDAETVTGTDAVRATTPANITAKMAAPGAIGGTTPGAATFTTVTTTGNIELGHASDTTLSRASAGVLAVEGVNVLTTATGLPLSGGTMTGSITLGENTGIALDPAGSADGKWSGITIAATAGYAQTYGDLVYLASADSRWELADADAAATADRFLAMVVVAGGSDGAACTLLLQGQIRADAKFPALTVGSAVYVGETAGAIQTAIPTGADNVIRRVGYALTADEIYFCPSMDSQTTVA